MRSKVIPLGMVSAGLLMFAACTGEPSDSDLDDYLCNRDDIGAGYHELARGELSRSDLDDLSDGAGGPPRGVLGGKFVFYSEALERPPFSPPIEVVCQALEFESDLTATEWVDGLSPGSPLLSAVVGVLADGGAALDDGHLSGHPETRVFVAVPGGGRSNGVVLIGVGANGRFVRAIAVGGQRLESEVPIFLLQLWRSPHAEPTAR